VAKSNIDRYRDSGRVCSNCRVLTPIHKLVQSEPGYVRPYCLSSRAKRVAAALKRKPPTLPDLIVCRRCGMTVKPELCAKEAGRIAKLCLKCNRKHTRQIAAGGMHGRSQDLIEQAPDSRPAVRVRAQLERDRLAGLPWNRRRFVAVVRAAVTDDLDGYEWKVVLLDQIPAWRRGYTRTGPEILSLAPSLFDDPEQIVQSGSRAVA
jgi:hypothetical protein